MSQGIIVDRHGTVIDLEDTLSFLEESLRRSTNQIGGDHLEFHGEDSTNSLEVHGGAETNNRRGLNALIIAKRSSQRRMSELEQLLLDRGNQFALHGKDRQTTDQYFQQHVSLWNDRLIRMTRSITRDRMGQSVAVDDRCH